MDGAVSNCPVACHEFTGSNATGLSLALNALLSSVAAIDSLMVPGSYGPTDLATGDGMAIAMVSFEVDVQVTAPYVSVANIIVEPQMGIAGAGLAANASLVALGLAFVLQPEALYLFPSALGALCSSSTCTAADQGLCALASASSTVVQCACGAAAGCSVAGAQCTTTTTTCYGAHCTTLDNVTGTAMPSLVRTAIWRLFTLEFCRHLHPSRNWNIFRPGFYL
jgi:hypothetical protein